MKPFAFAKVIMEKLRWGFLSTANDAPLTSK